MIEHTHAPGWRGRPKSAGKIEDADWIEPNWLRILNTLAPAGCVGLAGGLLAAAAFTWAAGG